MVDDVRSHNEAREFANQALRTVAITFFLFHATQMPKARVISRPSGAAKLIKASIYMTVLDLATLTRRASEGLRLPSLARRVSLLQNHARRFRNFTMTAKGGRPKPASLPVTETFGGPYHRFETTFRQRNRRQERLGKNRAKRKDQR